MVLYLCAWCLWNGDNRVPIYLFIYLEKLFHVYLDVFEGEGWIEFSEILVLEVFGYETGCFQVGTFYDIYQFDEVRVGERS